MPKDNKKLPEINGAVVAIVLRELVRRAIVITRRQMPDFEVTPKLGYDGEMDDIKTTADELGQRSYVKLLQECFPGFGIIGEEEGLMIQADGMANVYFTVDPLDGTKAYLRRQSHGVGSMVALVVDEVVVAAYVGDVNTREIFGYRPDSSSVWRLIDSEKFIKLDDNPLSVPIDKSYIQLRKREKDYGTVARQTIDYFNSVSIDSGSIGTWSARLWKGETGALLLTPSWETPWDSAPIIGISKKLGYVFLRPRMDGWEEYEPIISRTTLWKDHETLIIHRNRIKSLEKHMRITYGSDRE